MDRAGDNRPRLTEDELETVFQVVAEGRNRDAARRQLGDRTKTTVHRAFNVVAEFERLGLGNLDDTGAQLVARAAGYEASVHYVQNVFLRWKAWKTGSSLVVDGQKGEIGSEANHAEPQEGLLTVRDPELGPHGREQFHFGRRFWERIFVSPPDELLAKAVGTNGVDFIRAANRPPMMGPMNLWLGKAPWERPLDTEEARVEREWGFGPYDATEHSLYPSFRQHLQGHPGWNLLDMVSQKWRVYLEEVQRSPTQLRELWVAHEDVTKSIDEIRASLRPDARLRKLILDGRCDLCPLASPRTC